MIKIRKQGFCKSWNNPYKTMMGTANVFPKRVCPVVSDSTLLDTYGAQLAFLAVVLLCGCSSETLVYDKIQKEFVPELRTQTNVDLPVFDSCPNGWNEVEFDAGNGYMIPYCEPPNLSELNPESPQQPSLPNFLPCPSGWTEVEDVTTGLVTCHPYGSDGPEDCDGDDEAGNIDKIHFPGEPGCVRIGRSCPEESPWATNLPVGRTIVYVQAGADFGEQANGSQAAPFGRISDAIEHAGSDTIIALSKGIYNEPVVLQRGIVLWGACVAETEVTSSIVSETEAVITTAYAGTEVRNLRITGQKWGVFVLGSLATAHIEDVVVKSAHMFGIYVNSGSATVRNVVVRDTQGRQSDAKYGFGLLVTTGALVEVSRSVFTNNKTLGIDVYAANTELTLHDVRVSDTQSEQSEQSDGLYGIGLNIEAGASVEVYRSVLSNNREVGIFAYGTNTELTLHDVIVSDTQGRQSDGLSGRGLNIESGPSVEVYRSVFTNNREMGVFAGGINTELTLHDVIISDTQSGQNDGEGGRGLYIAVEASAEVARTVLSNNREAGIVAYGTNTELTLNDVIVRDTQGRQSDGKFGSGLKIIDGASAEVARSVLSNNREFGIVAHGPNTELTLHDVRVQITQSMQSNGGLVVQKGASAEVSRSVLSNNRKIGISAIGTNTELTLHDVRIHDTQSMQDNGEFGRGLQIGNGASAVVSHSLLSNNREAGIFAFGTNTELTLHDVQVRDTQSMKSNGEFGRGLHIQTGASAEVVRSVFTNNREVGISAIGIDTELTLYDVIVRDTQGRQSDEGYGRGLHIQEGASVKVSRSVFINNRDIGIYVGGINTETTFDDIIVVETIPMKTNNSGGTGIGSYGGARIELNRFVVSQNALCGVQVAFGIDESGKTGGEVTLSNGIISHNEVCGINVQTDTVNLNALTNSVIYFENNYNNLDSALLLTPKASLESLPAN